MIVAVCASIAVAVRTPGENPGERRQQIRKYKTFYRVLGEMVDWLADEGVTHVAMEATGVYWKPLYNLCEGVFTVLVVNATVPAQTLDEFVKLAKSQPGKLSYGSAGHGSVHHLTMALFAERAGIDLLHVPYRGGTALVNGLLTGEIQAGWSGFPNVMALIESGRLRALCVSVVKRSSSLPRVPTCSELGYGGFDIATMIGLQASAGLPQPIVGRLQARWRTTRSPTR